MLIFSCLLIFGWLSGQTLSLFLSGNKRKQIDQVVHYLEERLRELDEEKEELRKYQQLDKQRRSLEYTIFDKELQVARQNLNEVSSLLMSGGQKIMNILALLDILWGLQLQKWIFFCFCRVMARNYGCSWQMQVFGWFCSNSMAAGILCNVLHFQNFHDHIKIAPKKIINYY